MQKASDGQPDPEWVRWAEAESVLRLQRSLDEIRSRREVEAVEAMERDVSAWEPGPTSEVVLDPPPSPTRVIRIHAENLLDA